MNDSTQIIDSLETLNGKPLSEEESAEIQIWNDGRLLAQLVHFPGWAVALRMLKDYADKATEDLLSKVHPGSPEVPTAHAAAYAVNDLFWKFQEDIKTAINMNTPEVLKKGYKAFSGMPPESLG